VHDRPTRFGLSACLLNHLNALAPAEHAVSSELVREHRSVLEEFAHSERPR